MLKVFQVKDFASGSLTSSRKGQIRRSLERVHEANPDKIAEWILFVPMNPTPEMLDWFNELTQPFPFPCHWHGLPQWDSLASRYRDVIDYYILSGREALEQSISDLTDIFSMRDRLQHGGQVRAVEAQGLLASLVRRINEGDPHYSYQLHVTEEPLPVSSHLTTAGLVASVTRVEEGSCFTVDVIAKYDYSVIDCPIPLSVTLSAEPGSSEAQAIREFIDYGRPLELHGAHAVAFTAGLPSGLGPGPEAVVERIRITPSTPPGSIGDDLRLEIVEDDGSVAASSVVTFEPATTGFGGKIARDGVELAGTFTVKMRFEPGGIWRWKFGVSPTNLVGRPIRQVSDGLAFIAAASGGRSLQIAPRYGDPVGDPMLLPDEMRPDPEMLWLFDAVADLTVLQTVAPRTLLLVDEFSADDLRLITEAARLLRNERIVGAWSNAEVVVTAEADLTFFEGGNPLQIRTEEDLWLEYQEMEIPIGVIVHEFQSAMIESIGSPEDDGSRQIRMKPAGSDLFEKFRL